MDLQGLVELHGLVVPAGDGGAYRQRTQRLFLAPSRLESRTVSRSAGSQPQCQPHRSSKPETCGSMRS